MSSLVSFQFYIIDFCFGKVYPESHFLEYSVEDVDFFFFAEDHFFPTLNVYAFGIALLILCSLATVEESRTLFPIRRFICNTVMECFGDQCPSLQIYTCIRAEHSVKCIKVDWDSHFLLVVLQMSFHMNYIR